jgi:hypothetical protein
MNLAATVTISVYFVGLVNFSGTGATREVVAPLATTPVIYGGVTLQAHRTDVVLTGLTAAECATLGGGSLIFPGGKCLLTGVVGKRITLPTGSPLPLDTSAHNIPKLTALCPAVSGIKDEYLVQPAKYAVRMTLDSGTLDTCVDGKAWGSRLVLTANDGKVTIGDKTVTVDSGATIHIMNRPLVHTATSGPEHFFWHYVIAKDATGCVNVPTTPPSGSGCPLAIGQNDPKSHPAASGLGCSNSTYP